MSNFSGRGYITLSDLDSIANRLKDVEDTLGSTVKNTVGVDQVKDFLYYRNDDDSATKALTFINAGVEAHRVKADIKDENKIVVKFAQDWKEVPIVCATIDGSSDQYACQIDSIGKTQVTIRFMKIKSVPKNNSIKAEYVNVIAVGQTKN